MPTARLPIDKYIKLSTRHVLTVNQVLEIMLYWLKCKNWEEAFLHVIPKRKFDPAASGIPLQPDFSAETVLSQSADDLLPQFDDAMQPDFDESPSLEDMKDTNDTENGLPHIEDLPSTNNDKQPAYANMQPNFDDDDDDDEESPLPDGDAVIDVPNTAKYEQPVFD